MAKTNQTPGDKRMLQASRLFAEGKFEKADADYSAAITAYKHETPPNAERAALAFFTRALLRLKGMITEDATPLITGGMELTKAGQSPALRRFHALFHLQAASQARLGGDVDEALCLHQEARNLLNRDGEQADQFELHHEGALLHIVRQEWEASEKAARGTLDRAQHPEQRLAAQFLMAECKEAAGDAPGALAALERAAAIVFDHKITDGPQQLKARTSGLLSRHPELDTDVDDSEWL